MTSKAVTDRAGAVTPRPGVGPCTGRNRAGPLGAVRGAPDRGQGRILFLTSIRGGISEEALTELADALAHKRNAGTEIILVSSGAIAAGLAPLGLAKRPRDLATQQAAASVGQGLLMARYTHAFGAHGVTVSQVLLTAEDFMRRRQHTNALRALDRLLNLGVVPVVNENDTVATHEIRFGDNDRLAALVAHLVRADALVLLSDVDSLYDGPPAHGAQRIPHVAGPQDLDGVTIGGTGKAGTGTGGMVTKVEAATIAAGSGIPALVTSTAQRRRRAGGGGRGNLVLGQRLPQTRPAVGSAHLASVQGTLVLDDGAVRAVRDRHTSLLPAGITAVRGDFEAGDAVEMVSPDGTVIARGLVNYGAPNCRRCWAAPPMSSAGPGPWI